MIKSSKAKFLPRLNAFGNFEMYDDKFAQFGANGYLAGLQLSWNVFDGLKSKSEQEKYKAELTKAQTEIAQYNKQSQLELSKSNRQVQDAENKVNLTKLALEQSKEAYRIRKNRYEQGLEESSDLLMSETTTVSYTHLDVYKRQLQNLMRNGQYKIGQKPIKTQVILIFLLRELLLRHLTPFQNLENHQTVPKFFLRHLEQECHQELPLN